MIGRTFAINTARTRWGNLKLAFKHYRHKELAPNTALGAWAGAGIGAWNAIDKVVIHRGSANILAETAIGMGEGILLANVLAGGYRFVRTVLRNPNSAATKEQMKKWERDLAGPSIFSKWFKRS